MANVNIQRQYLEIRDFKSSLIELYRFFRAFFFIFSKKNAFFIIFTRYLQGLFKIFTQKIPKPIDLIVDYNVII